MKQVSLTRGKVCIVDDEDFAWLSKWKWSAGESAGGVFYAVRGESKGGVSKSIFMHRQILGLEAGNLLTGDHINRDTLDNRRSNLRIATRKENCANRGPRSRSKAEECSRLESLFPGGGVSVNFWRGKWIVKANVSLRSIQHVESVAKSFNV